MGIRSKQINMNELYDVLDERYGSSGKIINVSVPANWTLDNDTGYYYQEVSNLDQDGELTKDSKLIIQAKFELSKSYEQNLENENLFSYIVRATPGDNSITFYSQSELDKPFNVNILFFA